MSELFPVKPWEFKGRRMERNAPSGTLCSKTPTCTSPRTIGYHCTVCHETFGGLSSFDNHRKDGWCLNPATLNLTIDELKVWRMPASNSFLALGRTRRATKNR